MRGEETQRLRVRHARSEPKLHYVLAVYGADEAHSTCLRQPGSRLL